jgi:hypothetical protein
MTGMLSTVVASRSGRLAWLAGILVMTWVGLGARGLEPRAIAGGRFEASGVAHVPGTSGVLFVDDSRAREVFWMEIGSDGAQKGMVESVPLAGTDITDLEGITSDGRNFFVVGSQSKATGFDGDGLARFSFDPATRRVDGVERIQGLKAWLAEQLPELQGTARKAGDRALNIEGIAWDPRGKRLLLGLREPVIDGQALVIPLTFRDRSAPFTAGNLVVDGGKAIRLPLNGAGIRSLEYDERARTFRIIAGAGLSKQDRDFRILGWDGDSTAASGLREVARFSGALKPEGITSGMLNGQPAGLVVFDTSRFALIQ